MKIASNAPGFSSSGSVYERLGQGEVVAPFNGGLTVTHGSAVGLPENLGGSLRPVRVYNSKTLEDAFLDDAASVQEYTDPPHGVLGMGWHLSYGRVLLRLSVRRVSKEDEASQHFTQVLWYYQDESGAEHQLFRDGRVEDWAGPGSEPAADWYFTNDGSYLRARYDRAVHLWRLYFPDGSSREAGGSAPGAFIPAGAHLLVPAALPLPWWDYITNPTVEGWYVTRIADRAGNAVSVAYNAYQPDPSQAGYQPYGGAIASLTDSFGRAMSFGYYPATDPAAPGLLATITCAGKTERFSYTQVRWTRPGQLVGTTASYPALARVIDPAGLETLYRYTEYTRTDGILRGLLAAVHYPTGAVSRYGYVSYPFPVPHPTTADPDGSLTWYSLAVSRHTVSFAAPGAPAGAAPNRVTRTWDRSPLLPAGRYLAAFMIPHVVKPVVETDALGTQSVRFFVADSLKATQPQPPASGTVLLPPGTEVMSLRRAPGAAAYDPAGNPLAGAVTTEIKRWAWGDAVVNGAVAGDTHRCLEYDPEHWGSLRVAFYGNLRVRRTESEELAPPPGPLPVAAPFYGWRRVTENSLWDGFGHYLLAETSGTPEIGQQPPPVLGQPRVPGRSRISASSYDLKTDIPTTGSSVIYQLDRAVLAFSGEGDLLPSGLGATGQFKAVASAYDAGTGLLASQVAYRQVQSGFAFDPATLALGPPATGAGDKALRIGYDPNGNVVRLFYSGGDGGNAYGFNFAWDHAAVSRMWRDGVAYDEFTRAVDPATSLIASQTDSNGFTTTFQYDALERLAAIRPPLPEHPTLVSYPNDVTAAGGETWTTGHDILFYRGPEGFVLTTSDAVTGIDPGASYAHYLSDGLGRTWKTRTLMPDGSFSEAVAGFGPLGRELFASLPYGAGDAAVSFVAVPHPLRTDIPGDTFSLYVPAKNGSAFGSWSSMYAEATAQAPLPLNGTPERLYRPLWAFRPDGTKTGTSYAGLVETATVYGIQTGPSAQSDSSTVYAKDVLGRLLLVLPPAGASAVHTYDGLGNLARVDLLALGMTPREACDAVLGPNGGTNALLAGQSTQHRSFTYDALGRLRQASNPENGTTNYLKYDCIGNLLEAQDANGAAASTSYKLVSSYDAVGRLLSTVKADAATGAALFTLIENTYDDLSATSNARGRLTKALSRQAAASGSPAYAAQRFEYNALNGRLSYLTVETDASGAATPLGAEFSYDLYGQVAGQGTVPFGVLGNSYTHGAVTARSLGGIPVIPAMSYDAAGMLMETAFGNGFSQSVAMDGFYRPAGFRLQDNGSAALWANGSYAGSAYSYDGAGNIASIGAMGGKTDSFQYDLLSRLTKATVNRTGQGTAHEYSYAYDVFGNLVSRSEAVPAGFASLKQSLSVQNAVPEAIDAYIKQVSFTATLAADAAGVTNNRAASVTRAGGTTGVPAVNANYVYDANGNLLEDEKSVYAYDALNRQVAVYNLDAAQPNHRGALVSQAFYDAAGERVARVTYDAAGKAREFTAYLRDGAAVIWEHAVSADNAAPVRDKAYVYAGGKMAYAQAKTQVPFTGSAYKRILGGATGTLGPPAITFEEDGEEARAAFTVASLTGDVTAFEAKVEMTAPPPGPHEEEEDHHGDDDSIQVQRVTQPAAGWGTGTVALSFGDLKPGATYSVTFTIRTTANSLPILGPRTVVLETGTFTVPQAPAGPRAWARHHWEHRDGQQEAEEDLTVGWENVETAPSVAYLVSVRTGTTETVLTPGPVAGTSVTLPVRSLPLPSNAASGSLIVTALNTSATARTAVPGGITPNVAVPPSVLTSEQYFATDHLGTVRACYTANPDGTTTLQTSDFEPFGAEIVPNEACDNTHRFTGQERDPETGNDNFHFRMYSAGMGRFLRPDSIMVSLKAPQSWNLYSYVLGNPVNFNDPTGHMTAQQGQSLFKNSANALGGGDDWWNDPDQMARFNWLKAIPGVPDIEVPTWGWGKSLEGIDIHTGIYFDIALGMTDAAKKGEYSRLQTEVLGAAFESFGAIGITFDVFYGGDVSITMNPPGSNEPAKVSAANSATVPIVPGSLNIVRTGNPNLIPTQLGAFFMNGRTGWIALGGNATAYTAREELMHALGDRYPLGLNTWHHYSFRVDRENLLLSVGIVDPTNFVLYRQYAYAYAQAR